MIDLGYTRMLMYQMIVYYFNSFGYPEASAGDEGTT